MSCTNIYGVVSSPSGRQRASKLTNLRRGIYWQKFIIILSLRRNVGAWELSVELRAQGEKGSLRCFCSDFLVQEVRGTEMCRHWDSWEHSGPSALASAVVPLHSPFSTKLHWFWEKFEEQLEILAGNPAKLQSTRHGHMHTWTAVQVVWQKYQYSLLNFSDFLLPAKIWSKLKIDDFQLWK